MKKMVSEDPKPLTPETRPDTPDRDDSRSARQAAVAVCLVALGLTGSVICATIAPEGVIHFDDVTHYLYAKWAWQWPAYLLDDWGRPGFTTLYFLPAKFGWQTCRWLSAALSAGCAWLAFRIAQTLGLRHAWSVVVLTYVQPLVFQSSQTTLTETPLAFYLTFAAYLALRNRWSWSAAVISLGLVTRHEAIIFLPIWMFFAWRRDANFWQLWPILWAPAAVNSGAWLLGLPMAIQRMVDPAPSTQYGQGGWLSFFARGLHAWGPGVFVLAMTGLWKLSRSRDGAFLTTCVAAYFLTQTAIRALGLYASGGYARFLIPISPLVAIAALVGWQRLWQENAVTQRRAAMLAGGTMILLWCALEREILSQQSATDFLVYQSEVNIARWIVRISTIAVTLLALISVLMKPRRRFAKRLLPVGLAGLILFACFVLCRPLKRQSEFGLIDEARQHLTENGLGDREIISANPWIDYVTGRALPPGHLSVREQLEQAPVGTLFAWERKFAASEDHKLRLDEFEKSPSFRTAYKSRSRQFEEHPYMTVFEKIDHWGPDSIRDLR